MVADSTMLEKRAVAPLKAPLAYFSYLATTSIAALVALLLVVPLNWHLPLRPQLALSTA